MNSEKVISNIKKAIKEHLDNNYTYDMLVDFELDVIDWNSLFEYIDKLQQENKQLKELIDTILNWDIFKNECPMNFGYDEETNENKAQDVFYKDDDYCENNCNDDYTKCWLKYFKKMEELEKGVNNE